MNDETVMNETASDETIAENSGNGAETAAAPEVETAPSMEEQLQAAQAEAEEFRDRWMRAQAEFANARKRMDKERVQTYQNARIDLTAKLLPILDDFERAMENVPDTIAADSWFEGIELVNRKLFTILEGMDVKQIEAVGEPFDPNLHEAINQEPSDEYESGTVVRELQKGYMLGDRVVRPSLVIIAA